MASDVDGVRLAEVAARPFAELQSTGLLWLLNKAALHARGFALALVFMGEECVGWALEGDGSEPWSFSDEVHEDAMFAKAKELLG